MTEMEISQRLQELEKLKIHPREDSKNQYLLAKGERLYEETLLDLRLKIAHELEKFEEILNKQDPMLIQKAAYQLERFLASVEAWPEQ